MTTAAESFPFCHLCGTILDFPDAGDVTCSHCGTRVSSLNDEGWREKNVVVTRSASRPVPEWIRQMRDDESGNAGDASTQRATVQETCPKCGHGEMEFYTLQLRSADEGQTVFYDCLNRDCRHTFSVNN
ncbi:unnamed protein product [Phaeothamnion confervicola]